jgi:hypothetical protein
VLNAWTNNAKKMKEQHREHKGVANSEEKHEEQEEQ